jgi:hypothetical protein
VPGLAERLWTYKLNIDRFDLAGTFVHVPSYPGVEFRRSIIFG